jgi:hypothetical protein
MDVKILSEYSGGQYYVFFRVAHTLIIAAVAAAFIGRPVAFLVFAVGTWTHVLPLFATVRSDGADLFFRSPIRSRRVPIEDAFAGVSRIGWLDSGNSGVYSRLAIVDARSMKSYIVPSTGCASDSELFECVSTLHSLKPRAPYAVGVGGRSTDRFVTTVVGSAPFPNGDYIVVSRRIFRTKLEHIVITGSEILEIDHRFTYLMSSPVPGRSRSAVVLRAKQ